MRRWQLCLVVGLALALLLVACGASAKEQALVIPIGRSVVVGESTFEVFVDAEPYAPAVTHDGYGGYWIRVPVDALEKPVVVLQIMRKNESLTLTYEEDEDLQRWLTPSEYIDSDHPAIVEKADELTRDRGGASEKARAIYDFLRRDLAFKIYRDHFRLKASETYERGYGTCVNHARLFVALSRAARVPARTVWGIVYANGTYDGHHEWAEFLDDDGYWHPLDSTFTVQFDLSDVRYLDLVYAAEENPVYQGSLGQRYSARTEEYVVYDTSLRDYDGKLGFEIVSDSYPDFVLIENQFNVAELGDILALKSP